MSITTERLNTEIDRLRKENYKLGDENLKLRRNNLKQTIELLSLKDEEFSHVNIKSIDDDGLDVIQSHFNSFGEDGLKLMVLKLYPKPEPTIQTPKITMLSEMDDYIKKLKPPKGYSKLQ